MKTKLIKSLFLSTLVAGSALLASCDENAGIVIGIPQTQEVIYKIDPFTGTVISKADTITSDLDTLLAQNGATREDIDGIELTNLSLAMTDSNGTLLSTANFNNIKNMNIYVSEVGGLSVAMANFDSASMATTFHNMNPITDPGITVSNPFSLLTYLSKPSFAVQLSGALYSPVTTSFYVKSTMTINIKVKI